MSLAPFLPLAGAAIGPLSRQAARGISQGLEFLQVITNAVSGNGAAKDSSGRETEFVSINQSENALNSLFAVSQTALEQLSEMLRDRFHAAGVDTMVPFVLQSDEQSQVVVAEPHPQQNAIEKLFEDDPELRNLFHFITRNFNSLLSEESSRDSQAGLRVSFDGFELDVRG